MIGCGRSIDSDSPELAQANTYSLLYVNAMRAVVSRLGWIFTGYRRADGFWPVLDFTDSAQRPRGGAAALFDVCPGCAPAWEPPISPTGYVGSASRAAGTLVGPNGVERVPA